MSTPPVFLVIPAMDTIDCAFTTSSMDDKHFSLPIKIALELSKRIMNKYYNLTDESEIYRSSIGMLLFFTACFLLMYATVLHPSLKTQYFKDNKWQQDWQDKAIAITRRIFETEYKHHSSSDDTPLPSMQQMPSSVPR